MTKKTLAVILAAVMVMAFMPSMTFAAAQRADSGVMISDAQYANAKTVETKYSYQMTFGKKAGGDITADSYKLTPTSSGLYMLICYSKDANGEYLYYTNSKSEAGSKIILNVKGYKVLSLTKGKTYYFYCDSNASDKSGYINVSPMQIAGANVKYMTSTNSISLPGNGTVKTMIAFKPQSTGYYKFSGKAATAPGITVYQTAVRSTANGKYGDYYGDLTYEKPLTGKSGTYTLYMHDAQNYSTGLLKLTKGYTYYYTVMSGTKVSGFSIRKYSPIQIKFSNMGCKSLLSDAYQYDMLMQSEVKYAAVYATTSSKTAVELAYFPETGKTLKQVKINGNAVKYTTADVEMVRYEDSQWGPNDDETFIDGKSYVTADYLKKWPDMEKYLTKEVVGGITKYYFTVDSMASANGASSTKVTAKYNYVKVQAPGTGWKTGDTISLVCE